MIVIGADTHKHTHALVAADAATGELLDELTVAARERGFQTLTRWARSLGTDRVWAIEDCRHVSGGLERWRVASGERVVHVAPERMAGARRSARRRGTSDPIDAAAVARAAIREGTERLPAAQLDSDALEIRLLVDHHDDLVRQRTADQCRLRWHLHDLWRELSIPAGARSRGLVQADRRSPRARQKELPSSRGRAPSWRRFAARRVSHLLRAGEARRIARQHNPIERSAPVLALT